MRRSKGSTPSFVACHINCCSTKPNRGMCNCARSSRREMAQPAIQLLGSGDAVKRHYASSKRTPWKMLMTKRCGQQSGRLTSMMTSAANSLSVALRASCWLTSPCLCGGVLGTFGSAPPPANRTLMASQDFHSAPILFLRKNPQESSNV